MNSAFALVALALLLSGALASGQRAPATPDEWIAWRDAQIDYILQPNDFLGESVVVRQSVAERCAEAYRTIVPSLPAIEADPVLRSEMRNLVAFVREQRNLTLPGHMLALDVTDVQYWKSSHHFVELPALLKSEAFLAMASDPKSYRDAVAMVERHNQSLDGDHKWTVLPFEAQFIKSVDRTTYGRLLVFVPGDERDLWVTFAIATPDQVPPARPDSVSVVAVDKAARRAHFMDFVRVQGAKGIELMPTAAMPQSPSKNCYDCHKTAVVPIRPEREFAFDDRGRLVTTATKRHEELNKRIRGYGALELPFLNASAYGPCVGPAHSDRRTRIVERMARVEGLGDASLARIASAMDCARCHASFAPLNYPEPLRTDRELRSMRRKKGIAQTFVENGWMPPGNDLTPAERRALWRALSTEYHDPSTGEGLLVDWLRGMAP